MEPISSSDADPEDLAWSRSTVSRLIALLKLLKVMISELARFVRLLMLARLRIALSRSSDTLSFALTIIAAYLYYRHREEPFDGTLLPTRRYPTSWGAVRSA